MALGKCSPTVSEAYRANEDWWDIYAPDGIYDPEGYDMYGYDKNDMDRHGYYEYDYNGQCECCGESSCDLYMSVRNKWGFDGVKPVRIT